MTYINYLNKFCEAGKVGFVRVISLKAVELFISAISSPLAEARWSNVEFLDLVDPLLGIIETLPEEIKLGKRLSY